jgi:putative ABC transport system permease protein
MSQSRPMFWRIVRRLIVANRGRLAVILLALGASATVTAALINLQFDAKRRISAEFRSFGANVVVSARNTGTPDPATIPQAALQKISQVAHDGIDPTAFLYFLGGVSPIELPKDFTEVIVAGTSANTCAVGIRLASQLKLSPQQQIWIASRAHEGTETCRIAEIKSTGGPEDDQITIPLEAAQRLNGLSGRVSLIQIAVPGTRSDIEKFISALQEQIPDADVHGIRQFTEAEGKIYERISGLLTATVAVVLILTTLCVMAAMTNVAMERKNDVGLMKAIGGATRRVLRLFLAEAATLGLIAGIIGAAAGLALSVALGKAVFGVPAQPRLIVYPVVVALTILVAVAGAYPLRRLAGIRPASVFRGEA